MEDEFIELQHTPTACPFCGYDPDTYYGTQALNAIVCQSCMENLHIWNPAYAEIHTDDGVMELWAYTPACDEWRQVVNTPVLFLKPAAPATGLSIQTQRTIILFVTGQHRDLFERIPVEDVADNLHKLSTPKPLIKTNRHVYTSNPDQIPETAPDPADADQLTFEALS